MCLYEGNMDEIEEDFFLEFVSPLGHQASS